MLETNPEAKCNPGVLTDDDELYWMSPCGVKKWLVIELAEEIQVTKVRLLNREFYSSALAEIWVLGRFVAFTFVLMPG